MNVKHPIFGGLAFSLYPLGIGHAPLVGRSFGFDWMCVDRHLSQSLVININFCYSTFFFWPWIICFYFRASELRRTSFHQRKRERPSLLLRAHAQVRLTKIDQSYMQSTWLDFSHDTYKTRIYNRIFHHTQTHTVSHRFSVLCVATAARCNYGQVKCVNRVSHPIRVWTKSNGKALKCTWQNRLVGCQRVYGIRNDATKNWVTRWAGWWCSSTILYRCIGMLSHSVCMCVFVYAIVRSDVYVVRVRV